MGIEVKICGLRTPEAIDVAVSGGARYLGFVFFPASPRALVPEEAALLASNVAHGIKKVGLVVDADDALLDEIIARVPLEMLQLHGRETPKRAAEIKRRYNVDIIKAIPVEAADDIEAATPFEGIADMVLFDAKPCAGATRPGGNARAFDWTVLKPMAWKGPWMLAGGLNAANLGEAVRLSEASMVDVSSGIEDALGVKNPEKITTFLAAARNL
jgi:phosphoribosylanthranilate isomerase